MMLAPLLVVCLSAFLATGSTADGYFPSFHVRPNANWINDPNGPFRDPKTNLVHLWMQYNPDAAIWGNMSWWHAVTEDYVTWQRIGVSLTNDAPYDRGGVFSGSVSLDKHGDPVIFYTCVDAENVQRQCIAKPTNRAGDALLLNWTKSSANPVLSSIPHQNGGNNFRDPTTGWYNSAASRDGEEIFYFATGVSVFPPSSSAATAMVALFQTPAVDTIDTDFNFTGKFLFGDPFELSMMFECPDFFLLPRQGGFARGKPSDDDDVAIVKASSMTTRHDYFYMGSYNATELMVNEVQMTPVAVDYGMWYASKTFWDSTLQARILFGWIGEEDTGFASRGWAGVQSIPRVVEYDSVMETVRTYPLPQLEGLRGDPLVDFNVSQAIDNNCIILHASSVEGGAAQHEFDVIVQVPMDASFRIEARVLQYNNESSYTALVVDSNMPSGGSIWNNTDQPGGDYKDFPLPGTDDSADQQNCSAACAADRRCVAWTYVRPGFPAPSPPFNYAPRCSLKWELPAQVSPGSSCCVSGRPQTAWIALSRDNSGSLGATTPWQGRATIMPSPFGGTEGTVRLRVFVDHSVIEAFKDDGLERISGRVYVPPSSITAANGFSVCGNTTSTTGGALQLQRASMWPLKSIW